MERIQRVPDVLWRDCGDRLVLVVPHSGDPLVVNEPGRSLWLAAEEPIDVADWDDTVGRDDAAGRDDTAGEDVEADVASNLAQAMVDGGLMRWCR